ncbi:transposase, partial [Candidatus Falkowbacteria bacterium]|nr:transposase [Candidatus Falkowbacteria bacterium]
VYDSPSNYSAICFLKELIKIAPFKIKAIKTDNDACFTNRYTGYLKSTDTFNPRLHPLDLQCQELNIAHYLIDPGKPAQNGNVERSHRSDQESFYNRVTFTNVEELRLKLRLWNMYYNDLEHCSLNGKTPNEFLSIFNQLKPTKVCA